MQVDIAPNGDRRGLCDFPKVYDGYDDDHLHAEVMRQLLLGAMVRMAAHRNDLPHRREMRFTLSDGREFRIFLDQGSALGVRKRKPGNTICDMISGPRRNPRRWTFLARQSP